MTDGAGDCIERSFRNEQYEEPGPMEYVPR